MDKKKAIEIIAHFDKHTTPCDEYGYLIDRELFEAFLMAANKAFNVWTPVTGMSTELPTEE